MDGIGFVFIESVGVIFGLIILLVTIALGGWFGFAVGSAIDEDSGGFWGMIIGVVASVALILSI